MLTLVDALTTHPRTASDYSRGREAVWPGREHGFGPGIRAPRMSGILAKSPQIISEFASEGKEA